MSVEERRARLVTRHHLGGAAPDPVGAARAVVVLHATDPATVYLSVLARCRDATLDSVGSALYDERRLVRMMAMRRTLFVVPIELSATVHHAASVEVAAMLRRRLVKELSTAPTDPPLSEDVAGWLAATEAGVEDVLRGLGTASGAQLARSEPRLRTAVLPQTDKKYDIRRAVTSQVLVMMGAEGRIVRDRPLGAWTSRQHTWTSAAAYWPDGIPREEPARARATLAEAYLRRFGPATEADVAWWTGWSLRATRTALGALDLTTTDEGLVLTDDVEDIEAPEPSAALLPALDPTPMGWKGRAWFLPENPRPLYDPYGNIGPTVWWGGEIVGGWAVRPDGSVATHLLADRGRSASEAVQAAAELLGARLGGAVVVPSFRTPLERELAAG